MSVLLNEFRADLLRISKLLEAVELLRSFPAVEAPKETDGAFVEHSAKIHAAATSCHTDLAVFPGTLVLYLAGRFEFFVRSVFEELSDSIASRSMSYDSLPKVMRTNLVAFTAEVVKDPRKYGHAEKGVESFIKILAENLTDRSRLTAVNSACLSITHENMRPDSLEELFGRIGADKVWDKLGAQAPIQALYETADPSEARSNAKRDLNVFMDMRNKVAHPSQSIIWPDSQKVKEYIRYFEVVGEALVQIAKVYEVSLPSKPSQATTKVSASIVTVEMASESSSPQSNSL